MNEFGAMLYLAALILIFIGFKGGLGGMSGPTSFLFFIIALVLGAIGQGLMGF